MAFLDWRVARCWRPSSQGAHQDLSSGLMASCLCCEPVANRPRPVPSQTSMLDQTPLRSLNVPFQLAQESQLAFQKDSKAEGGAT